MKITLSWLKSNGACSTGIEWFTSQKKTNSISVLKALIVEKHYDWANWTICRLFTHKQKVRYALFVAEQVIEIYEKENPGDNRPRVAIEATKKWLDNPTLENQNAANAATNAAANAAYAAANAAYAAYAAANAAYAAANAAYAVANAVAYAANANAVAYADADADADAANAVAYAANAAYTAYTANAAYAARENLQRDVLEFGMKLLTGRKAKRAVVGTL